MMWKRPKAQDASFKKLHSADSETDCSINKKLLLVIWCPNNKIQITTGLKF